MNVCTNFDGNHKCQLHGGTMKSQAILKIIIIHHLGTMNVGTNFSATSSENFDLQVVLDEKLGHPPSHYGSPSENHEWNSNLFNSC